MADVMSFSDEHGAQDAADADPGRALCRMFIDALPVAGASISVVTERGSHSVVGASDALAVKLEALQFELGVGPHWEALRTEGPAFLWDAADMAGPNAWPTLALETVRCGAGALFALPLRLGAATVGVADLYSRSPVERWSDEMIDVAQDLALSVAGRAVRLATRSAEAATSRTGRNAVELRREVHQATGMVMVQLDCSASTALLRLRGQAFASGVPLAGLAREVITRRFDFGQL
ncbi:GAF and ANTAR domain-containing protein [Amnibacterium sp.]|uniref:GAF and ANTAR domain-containing protein n=1 Tax=Amnibacterium sp. TaxID=1872496 RepID=UPI00262C947E|nr:GAF and ANTAR domain-containing protein [Amnibacterium sp.]